MCGFLTVGRRIEVFVVGSVFSGGCFLDGYIITESLESHNSYVMCDSFRLASMYNHNGIFYIE